jgi:predicted O-methyltransferase YrrM
MSIGLEELIPLLELARLTGAKTALEIGTGSGGTTWHLAANLGSNGEVLTVDLPIQADENEYSPARIATVRPTASRLGCYFKDTPEAARISQLLMDSRELSSKDVGQEVDIVFIDGAHAYEYVKSDTELALSLLKPGGLVVWHDYFVFHPDYGVRRYLHNLAYSIPLYRLTDSICAVACVK